MQSLKIYSDSAREILRMINKLITFTEFINYRGSLK